MATIAVIKSTGQRGLVIGTGFGMFRAYRTSSVIAHSVQRESAGEEHLIALANESGEISWHRSADVQIVEVDGKPPHVLLSSEAYR